MISTTGREKYIYHFRCGFSVVEMIVVIAIICSVMLASSLYFRHHLSHTLLKTSAQDIVSTLRLARRLAITKRKIHKVVFEPGRRKYWIEDSTGTKIETAAYLKKGVIWANPELGKWGEENGIVEAGVPDNTFLFYPQGTTEGGSVYVKRKGTEKWYTITLVPTTGMVRIYQDKH